MLAGDRRYGISALLFLAIVLFFAVDIGLCATWSQDIWSTTVYYRTTFEAEEAVDGVIRVAAVDSYVLYFGEDEIGTGEDWTVMAEYPIKIAKGANHIALEVTNKGQGEGRGVVVDVEAGELRVVSTADQNKGVWYWLAEEPKDEAWTTADVATSEETWQVVQLGDLNRAKVSGLVNPAAEVIAGYPGGVDISSSQDGRIMLKQVQGENLALGQLASKLELTDGSRATSWKLTPNSLNEFTWVDLRAKRRINKVRVVTEGTTEEDLQGNSLRGYSVQISDDRFRWIEVGVLHNIKTYDQTEVAFRSVLTRYVRVVVAEVDGVNSPRVAEFEIYGDGYAPEGAFLSEPLDFGDPALSKNFGPVTWEAGETPEGTTLSVQFRTGDTSDSWSEWSEEYTEESKGEDGTVVFSSPEPAKLLQYKVNFTTTDETVTPEFTKIGFEYFTDIPVSESRARISPNRVVMGEDSLFSYTMDLVFDASDMGIKKWVISMPSLAQVDESAIQGVDGAAIEQIRTLPTRLEIIFTNPIGPTDQISQIVLPFQATLYSNAHRFRSFLFGPTSDDPLNVQESTDADTSGVPYSWSVFTTDVVKKALTEVEANPRVLSPNGDGVCDFTVIEFALAKVGEPKSVEIKIFDLTGTVVRDLKPEPLVAGRYTHPRDLVLAVESPGFWDGMDNDSELVPPGIYLYHVKGETGQGRRDVRRHGCGGLLTVGSPGVPMFLRVADGHPSSKKGEGIR